MNGGAETDNTGCRKRRLNTMRLAMIAVTLGIGVVGIAALQDNIAGQFHDDAMYMAAAYHSTRPHRGSFPSRSTAPPTD